MKRITDTGAVLFGKTNVPLMLADWQSFNDIYGTTNNPWDLTRAPGGSSGGSAAALATGMSALEIGSDIGASIRNPAHYCGVYGHKPTFGIVPIKGQRLPGVVSSTRYFCRRPLGAQCARSDRDAQVDGGSAESRSATRLSSQAAASRHKDLKEFRVAVMLTDPVSEVDQPVQDLIAQACALSRAAREKALL